MSWRRASLAAAAAVVFLGALVAIGRWERARQIHRQSAGMRTVLRLIGPLDNPTLAGFRVLPAFDCLAYQRGQDPLALEICVASNGRVVEAIDRRGLHRRFWTLRFEPSASPVLVDRAEVVRLIRKMEAT